MFFALGIHSRTIRGLLTQSPMPRRSATLNISGGVMLYLHPPVRLPSNGALCDKLMSRQTWSVMTEGPNHAIKQRARVEWLNESDVILLAWSKPDAWYPIGFRPLPP
jgi:hypothetical protein